MLTTHKSVETAATLAHSEAETILSEISRKVPISPADSILQFYDFLEVVGKGSFGTVFKTQRKSDGAIVATKLLPKTPVALREAWILSQLSHSNVVELLEVFHNTEFIFLVQEYCDIKLADVLATLKETDVVNITDQLLSALDHLQTQGIVHRDIKPDNVMLKSNNGRVVVKLVDFGIAVKADGVKPLLSGAGTNYFIAPEVINNEYNCKADIWSLGIMVVLMLNKELPFRSSTQRQIFQEILAFDHKSLAFKTPSNHDFIDLILKFLESDAKRRPTPSEALNSKVFLKQREIA